MVDGVNQVFIAFFDLATWPSCASKPLTGHQDVPASKLLPNNQKQQICQV